MNLTNMTMSERNQRQIVRAIFFHLGEVQILEELTDVGGSEVQHNYGSSIIKQRERQTTEFWGAGKVLFLDAGTILVCKQSPNSNMSFFCIYAVLNFFKKVHLWSETHIQAQRLVGHHLYLWFLALYILNNICISVFPSSLIQHPDQ